MNEQTIAAFIEALRGTGVLDESQVNHIVRVCANVPAETSLPLVCKRMAVSKKTLQRRSTELSLPAVKKLLTFGHLFATAYLLQNDPSLSIERAARLTRYSEPTTFSDQCKRYFGVRPAPAREQPLANLLKHAFETTPVAVSTP